MKSIALKLCSKCQKTKPSTEFYADKRNKSGLVAACKQCYRNAGRANYKMNIERIKAHQREYVKLHPEENKERCKKWYREHKDYALEKSREWVRSHPKKVRDAKRKYFERNKEIIRKRASERDKQWRLEHPGEAREKSRQYCSTHKEQRKECAKRYREKYPEKRALFQQNRRARQAMVGGTITPKEWEDLKNKYGNKCLCCGKTNVKLTLDHIVPLDPGRHVITNVQPLCQPCNTRKGRKTIDYRP